MVIVMTDEALVELTRGGNRNAVEELLQSNREYLYKMARRLSNNPDTLEDLVQEGSIALLNAVSSYELTYGVLFLTYATPFIRKAMHEFMARMSLPMTVPAARYSQLRRVNYLVAKFQMDNEERPLQGLLQLICQEMQVSEKVALGLLRDYYEVCQEGALDEQWEQSIPCFDADPAKVYEQELLAECIQTAFDESAPRERVLIQQYLGLGNSNGKGMTFQELAVLLNYNGHSAAEKAYKKAIESLKYAIHIGKYGNYSRAKEWLITSFKDSV